MARIGTVTKIENIKDGSLYVVIRGLGRVEDGQRLHFKKDSWTIVKKRWTKGIDTSFKLKSLFNKVPEIGQKLELIIDNTKFTIEGGHSLDVIDCFILSYKNETIYSIILHGIAELKKNDIITNSYGASWKIIETSMNTSSIGANRRFMVLVEPLDDSQLLPMQGAKLIKTNTDDEDIIQEEPTQIEPVKIPKPKKPNAKKSKTV
jgi:hypothetical protein